MTVNPFVIHQRWSHAASAVRVATDTVVGRIEPLPLGERVGVFFVVDVTLDSHAWFVLFFVRVLAARLQIRKPRQMYDLRGRRPWIKRTSFALTSCEHQRAETKGQIG